MKFFLTIFVCSVVNQNCAEVPPIKYDYKRLYDSHYECVQKGLGESYAILFDGDVFAADQVEALELYARYSCQKVTNYQENAPTDTTPPGSKDL